MGFFTRKFKGGTARRRNRDIGFNFVLNRLDDVYQCTFTIFLNKGLYLEQNISSAVTLLIIDRKIVKTKTEKWLVEGSKGWKIGSKFVATNFQRY